MRVIQTFTVIEGARFIKAVGRVGHRQGGNVIMLSNFFTLARFSVIDVGIQ
jgi:hypothetical protein